MPLPVRSRYWLCTLQGYPYPQQCPLQVSSFLYCCWNVTETKLDLFVIYKSNRTFPCRLLTSWSPVATATTIQAYLDDPFPNGSASLGKIPDIVYLKVHATRKRKSSKKSKALSVYAHSKNADQFIHYNQITGVHTPLVLDCGLVPSTVAPENLE